MPVFGQVWLMSFVGGIGMSDLDQLERDVLGPAEVRRSGVDKGLHLDRMKLGLTRIAKRAAQKVPAIFVSQSSSPCQNLRSVASRWNTTTVFSRTSVNGRPERRVVWLTGRSRKSTI